ncbi:ABC transporter ATP-binding protein [Paludicola sp. MB14-C6]|uniref:ABC transporter ATP-binding protein n=1 Tax=Paludihabitans sp. MB14-C6 TaxID=3070656 RepID=UPI0027DB908B|nr:ABC transporter ATP-binding protein [Paludicola sp. MB14-C6]WMJ23744.1 ABC transporter ATP-binding protein [Paludicola sp. MB14-C6]
MSDKKEKKVKSVKGFMNNFYMMKLVWKISPSRVVLKLLNDFCGFASWAFFTVVFMKYIFGAAEIQRSFQEIVTFIVVTQLILVVILLFQAWFNEYYSLVTDQKIYYHLNKMLFEKATSVDMSCYENPQFYDNYTKATTEVFTRAQSVLDNMGIIFASFFSSVFVIYTMFSVNVWAGFFTFLPVIGNFVFGKIANKYYYKREMDNVPYKRRQDYVNRAVYLQKYSKEMRLTNIFNVLHNTYETAYNGIIQNVEKYWKKLFPIESVKSCICFPIVFEGLWLFAAFSAMVTKTILIGDFVILASAIVSTTWMLIRLTEGIVKSYKDGLYIENLKTFLNYKEKISENQTGDKVESIVHTLEFKDVSFRYDGSEIDVLSHVNFKVTAGQKIALVGHNGAGKTTLVKLIMRLYDPTQGEILLNGKNVKEYDIQAYRELIGTTFQDYQIFSMTVLENVIMSKIETEEQRERAVEALKESGVYDKIESLSNKADTILTREFDDEGAVLSGGQAQKVAVARAFAKDSPIMILDEPSSALDPVAEYEMYETIMKLCDRSKGNQKKLSIIISHRLSSAAMADYIYLLENGTVIEEGTHQSLMRQGEVYADMFIKQAESYLQEVVYDEA